ncbi:MAG TPA: FtsX-like permease family protein [Thermoanaerobaculia bacterium]
MILRALVLRPIVREKMRTILTVLGIAVGVAAVVAIQLSNQSALRAFGESVDLIAGRANYQIVPDIAPLDESILHRLRPLWAKNVRFAPVIDIEGVVEPEGTPIRLLAVDLLSDIHFRDYRYTQIAAGAEGEAMTSLDDFLSLFLTDSVVLPAPYAHERGLKIGSPITLNVLGHRATLVVRGILEAEGPATAFNGSIAICDIAVAQRNFGMKGSISHIDLIIPDDEIAAGIDLPPGVRLERPSRRNERVETMLRAFRVNLFALAGVALLVGMFLVYNTVLISILRRRKDVGVLKTLGTSPRQIFHAFVTEGLVFGIVGSIAGIALGHALASAILSLVGRTISTLYVATEPQAVQLTPQVVLMGLAVGSILAILSALQPALEASRLPPASMIRAGLQQRSLRPGVVLIAAAICFTAGAASSRIEPVGGVAVGGYLAVLFVVAGFSLLAPSIVRMTSRALAPLLNSSFGIVGRLAAASLHASLRRTAIASAALSLAVGMMVAVALMVGSFRETVRIWVDQTVSSDIWLRPSKGLSNSQIALFPAAVADEVAALPFVAAVDRARGRDIVYQETIIALGSGDFAVAAQRSELPMVAPRSARQALASAIEQNGVVVSESFAIKQQKQVGDSIDLPTAGGIRRFPITGIYRDYSNDRGVVVMDRSLYVSSFRDDTINTIVIYLQPGITPAEARVALEKSVGAKHGAFVVTNQEVRSEVMKIFDQTFTITYALLGVAIIVAVLGIINTLSALILERRRELALLRVGGLSRNELRTMLVLESSLLGVASTAAGLVMGYALSWILINVINKQSFGWTIDFHAPVGLITVSLLTTFAAASLAGLAPARLAAGIDLAEAIKTE